MESTFTLVRVRGIPIGVNWSWLLVFGLVVWSLAQALFPATYPGHSGSTYVFMALVAAGLFFTSVLLHELGHALRALREGMPIRGITLWLFGGVAQLAGPPPSPRAEFHVAICGPVVSAGLAALFLGVARVGDGLGWPGPVQGVVDYLGRINLLVLAFNLIPALPLDGGRVLRSWLWRRQRSFVAATRSAARVGQAFGWMLVAIGVAGLFGGGSAFGGLWLAVIGWFLIGAARAEAVQAAIRHALGGRQVRDLMRPNPEDGPARATGSAPGLTVDADQPVHDSVGTLAEADGTVAVMDRGRQVGLLRTDDVNEALERGLASAPEGPEARRAGVGVWVVVGLVILVAGGLLYRPPYVVVAPGAVVDVNDDISIEGVPVDDLDGRYLLTTVSLTRRSALVTLWSALRDDRDVVALREVYPPGIPAEEYSRVQREVFRETRQIAAVAAARSAGREVSVSGTGARIVEVVEGSPADGVLQAGDVVVEVDGEATGTAAGLVEAIRSRPAGSELAVAVERDGEGRSLTVTSEDLADVAGGIGIGVLVQTRDLDVDLPFAVRFEERNIGGPSAGLAYGLALADLLDDENFARGRTIAATGTISLDGGVGAVGGIDQKAFAVDEAGADLFFVPQSEVDQAAGKGVPVRGVDRLDEALDRLRFAARG